jgi:phosphatidylglycerophosphate synthase
MYNSLFWGNVHAPPAPTGKHARNIRNSSPLGELFDHACDNLSLALATVQLFWIVGIYDNRLLYALTFAFSLNFFCEHLSAFDAVDRTIRFGKFTGPGEAIALW